ncbi:MAG: hypothetical protein ACOCSM_03080, partial [Bacillota bacterium]
YQYLASGFVAFQLRSVGNALEFTLLEGMISAGLAFGLYYGFEAFQKRTDLPLRVRPVTAGVLFALALMLTPLLELI